MHSTPILFIIFNRPEITKKSFEAIREYQPKKLYVSADGPRKDKDGEEIQCINTRKIIDLIDWECEVHTRFLENNLGCKYGPSTAIDWLFENEEFGIILEDDCIPDRSFFTFCEEMLIKYQDEENVSLISGFNALGEFSSEYSYIFSKIGATWGWATWRRAWLWFDIEMTSWPTTKKNKTLYEIFENKRQAQYREKICEKAYTKEIDTCWDYQWSYARLLKKSMAIMPSVNLISNIGFGEEATHHKNIEDSLKYPPSQSITFPLNHPIEKNINHHFDDLIFTKTINYKPTPIRIVLKRKLASFKNYLLRLIK